MSGADGVLVAVEGGDGAGKSVQARLLAQALRARGHDVLLTRQPGGTDLGAALRTLLLHGGPVTPRAEALLFAADKAEHTELVLRPALAAGQVVITDRFTDSAVAYQGAGRDLGAAEVHDLQTWAVDALVPDLTVVLDVPPEVARARRATAPDRLEAQPDAFHAAVREHFLAVAHGSPHRYLVLDGTPDADTVHDAVLAGLDARGLLPQGVGP